MVAAPSEAVAWRFERKFVTGQLSDAALRHLVRMHPAGFSEIFHERFVNNIYLDTPSRRDYHDNVDGAAARSKLRVRWYGALRGEIGSPVLEWKQKRGLLGCKLVVPLPPFRVDARLDRRRLEALFDQAALPDTLRWRVRGVLPMLVNRYRRRYFRSADGRFRITLDSDLCFYAFAGGAFLHRAEDHVRRILELKYAEEDDDAAERITRHLPLRVTRNSKYVIGLDLLEGRGHDEF